MLNKLSSGRLSHLLQKFPKYSQVSLEYLEQLGSNNCNRVLLHCLVFTVGVSKHNKQKLKDVAITDDAAQKPWMIHWLSYQFHCLEYIYLLAEQEEVGGWLLRSHVHKPLQREPKRS